MKGYLMTYRSTITLGAAGLAAILGAASVQAAPEMTASGQSARAGTATQPNMRAQARQSMPEMSRERVGMQRMRDWEDSGARPAMMPDRQARPDRQR